MAENSRIEWTDHTFNPWWGCTKVSPACDHCYAEVWAKRLGLDIWSNGRPRRFLSDSYWEQPHRWNAKAERQGRRARVFCASMADVFEWGTELSKWRQRLWRLIEETPSLDWLLLTKRPQAVQRLTPWGECWPDNVWLGATAENQRWAEKRLPHLERNPARIRFLSCEPLLGAVDLGSWLSQGTVHWIIAGGESGGTKARPTDPIWFSSLRDQCVQHEVPFHFKQWGDWAPACSVDLIPRSTDSRYSTLMGRFGKKSSGRTLDGQTWDEFPSAKLNGDATAGWKSPATLGAMDGNPGLSL